jgi:hypothetical protein
VARRCDETAVGREGDAVGPQRVARLQDQRRPQRFELRLLRRLTLILRRPADDDAAILLLLLLPRARARADRRDERDARERDEHQSPTRRRSSV